MLLDYCEWVLKNSNSTTHNETISFSFNVMECHKKYHPIITSFILTCDEILQFDVKTIAKLNNTQQKEHFEKKKISSEIIEENKVIFFEMLMEGKLFLLITERWSSAKVLMLSILKHACLLKCKNPRFSL